MELAMLSVPRGELRREPLSRKQLRGRVRSQVVLGQVFFLGPLGAGLLSLLCHLLFRFQNFQVTLDLTRQSKRKFPRCFWPVGPCPQVEGRATL